MFPAYLHKNLILVVSSLTIKKLKLNYVQRIKANWTKNKKRIEGTDSDAWDAF